MKVIDILLVDDDQDDQIMFTSAVKSIDGSINCRFASSGQQALQLIRELKETPPDIVFLDLNMMPMNGKECLAELRKVEWLKSVPIIIYTTSNSDKEALETKKLGAAFFLTKRNSVTDIKSDIALILQTFIMEPAPVERF